MNNKKITLTLLCILILNTIIFAQNWSRKCNFPDSVTGAVSFVANGYGYVGLGWNPFGKFDFHKYDTLSNAWTNISPFPGVFLGHAVGFSINDKGYVGTGISQYYGMTDFWEYDPLYDKWQKKDSLPAVGRTEATGFSANGMGYIASGYHLVYGTGYPGYPLNDLWEYNPYDSSWTKKAAVPGKSRASAFSFSINNLGFLGGGYDSSGKYLSDFYGFDPSLNKWTKKADFPGLPRGRASCFSSNGKGYVCGGQSSIGSLFDFWEYDFNTDKWTQLQNLDTIKRSYAIGFSIGDNGYIGTGGNTGSPYYKDFWEYKPYKKLTGVLSNIEQKNTNCLIQQNIYSIQITLTIKELIFPWHASIYDISGKAISKYDAYNNNLSLDKNAFKKGIYFIEVTENDKSEIHKIYIEK